MSRKKISLPKGEHPETAGLAVENNEGHPMMGDISIVNFWSEHETTRVHIDENEVDDLIEALKEVKA